MRSIHKNIQVMLEFLKAPFLVLHYSCYTLIIFLMILFVLLVSMLLILLYSKCNQAFNLWQQLQLASELDSDLQDTVNWGRKWLVDFNAGKTELVSFGRSNYAVAIDVKMVCLFLRKNHFLRCWGCLSVLDWIGGLILPLLLKLSLRKLEP